MAGVSVQIQLGLELAEKWVQKWVKGGFGGAKVCQHTSTHFGTLTKNHSPPTFKGGGNCSLKRALR